MSNDTAKAEAQVLSGGVILVAVSSMVLITMVVIIVVVCNRIVTQKGVSPDSRLLTLTMDKYLKDAERENPIKFTSQQLKMATQNFAHKLGSGGFGAVYKGAFSNGTVVAVKVLYACSHKRIEEQFIAEVSTIGRVHHPHLVQLYGYCFEKNLRALVYQYMENGSLDKLLFHHIHNNNNLGFEKLNEIAIGTAKGIAYLHEDCDKLIVHYDIKPGNILLDGDFSPKVADFGLAKLCNRDKAHEPVMGGRGTPGYAAPELWIPFPVTHKCDVYSFGMLLFEILGRRRNLDVSLPHSQEWFPKWVWEKFDNTEIGDLMIVCGVEAKDRETAEKMAKVALWCVQYTAHLRPMMSAVVKMLEGVMEIPTPSDPFEGMVVVNNFPGLPTWTDSSFGSCLVNMVPMSVP